MLRKKKDSIRLIKASKKKIRHNRTNRSDATDLPSNQRTDRTGGWRRRMRFMYP